MKVRRRRTRWWLGCLMMIQTSLLCGLVAAKPLQPHAPLRTPFYPTIFAVAELTLDGYSRSAAVGLNDAGQVLCSAAGDDGVPVRGFVWQGGSAVDIGSLQEGGHTIPYGINGAGSVVGASEAEDGSLRAFLWDGSTMQALPLPTGYTGSEAHAISANGRIAGDLIDASGHHAAVWSGQQVELLPVLNGFSTSRANAVNSSGQVVGTAFADGGPPGKGHAVLWQGGQVTDLGVADGYSFSEANTINEGGVIGGCSTEPPTYQVAMVWRTGSTSVLQGIGTVLAINDFGWTVGENFYTLRRTDYGRHATLFDGQYPDDLSQRVEYGGHYDEVVSAKGINTQAQVSANGATRALLLQPKVAAVSLHVDAPTTASIGQDATFTVTVTNAGPDEAVDFAVELDLEDPWGSASATSTIGTADSLLSSGWFTVDALPPGEWKLVVTAPPRAAGVLGGGVHCSAQNVKSLEVPFSVTVPGVPAPVVDGAVGFLDARDPKPGSGDEPVVSWEVDIWNDGTATLPAGNYELFLSASPTLTSQAKSLGSFPFHALKAADSEYRSFSRRIPRTRFPVGKYVIAVIDPTRDAVPKSLVGAIFVSDPIPAPRPNRAKTP